MMKTSKILLMCCVLFLNFEAVSGEYRAPRKGLRLLDGFQPTSCTKTTECRTLLSVGNFTIEQSGDASAKLAVTSEVITSAEDLCQQLKLDTGLDFDAGFASGSASVSIASKSGLRSDRALLLVTAIQEFALESFEKVEFKREALEKFATPEALLDHCGPEIIIGQSRSAEFHLFVSKAAESFSNQSAVGTSVAAKVPCFGGMHCSVSTFQANQEAKSDTKVRVDGWGLGNLSISYPAIEAALSDPKDGLEHAKKLIENHFLKCSRESGLPAIFFTEKTQCLIERAFGCTINRTFNGPHPRLKEIMLKVYGLGLVVDEWSKLLDKEYDFPPIAHERRKERRQYISTQFDRYGRALEDLRALGRQMIIAPATDVADGIASLRELRENPGRMDWCPYNRTYDVLEITPRLAGLINMDWSNIIKEMRLNCIKPILLFKPDAPSNRHDAQSKDVSFVIFDAMEEFPEYQNHLD